MHEPDQHVSPIKNWKQLVVVVALAFIVPIAVIIMLSQFITGSPKAPVDDGKAVLARIRPVGEVQVAAVGADGKELPPAAVKDADRTGQEVVQAACGKCHESGQGGAPKVGDRAAWTPRVAKGLPVVTQAALKGHGGMPARGGMAELSDVEVKRAIEYMFNSGVGKPSSGPVAAAGKPDGKKIYDTTCMACHATGAAGAPKLGDKAAWAPRLKSGPEALYASALKGKGAMPAKGGAAALADADVKAAVDYMAAAAR